MTAMSHSGASTGPINRKAAGQSPAYADCGTPRDDCAPTRDHAPGGPGHFDLVSRLRRWTHAVDAVPASDLMDEAADELERILKCDNAPATNPTPGEGTEHGACTLTDAEQAAIRRAAAVADEFHDARLAATLRSLLERTQACS